MQGKVNYSMVTVHGFLSRAGRARHLLYVGWQRLMYSSGDGIRHVGWALASAVKR